MKFLPCKLIGATDFCTKFVNGCDQLKFKICLKLVATIAVTFSAGVNLRTPQGLAYTI